MSREAVSQAESAAHTSPLLYFVIYLVLLVLAAVSYVLAGVEQGPWKLPIALVIAFVKGALVVLFFMHLWHHRGASRLTLAVALAFIAILMGLAIADAGTRLPITNPPTARGAKEFMPQLPLPRERVPNQLPARQPVAP